MMNSFKITFSNKSLKKPGMVIVTVQDHETVVDALKKFVATSQLGLSDVLSAEQVSSLNGKPFLKSISLTAPASLLDYIERAMSGTSFYYAGNESTIIIDLP